jgi:hypothetical protein
VIDGCAEAVDLSLLEAQMTITSMKGDLGDLLRDGLTST